MVVATPAHEPTPTPTPRRLTRGRLIEWAIVGVVALLAWSVHGIVDRADKLESTARRQATTIDDLRSVIASLVDDTAVRDCRGQLAAQVGAATADRDIADDVTTLAVGLNAGVEYPPEVTDLVEIPSLIDAAVDLAHAQVALVSANTVRVEYELALADAVDASEVPCPAVLTRPG